MRTLQDPEERRVRTSFWTHLSVFQLNILTLLVYNQKFEEDMKAIDDLTLNVIDKNELSGHKASNSLEVEISPSNQPADATLAEKVVDQAAVAGNTHAKSLEVEFTKPKTPVELIVAEKWFCVGATSLNFQDYDYKEVELFINVGWSERIDDPRTALLCSHSHAHDDHHHHSSHPSTGSTQPGEHHYQLPYTLHKTFKSNKLIIFDFVVGKKSVRWVRRQPEFQHVVIQSAIEAIEESYGEKVNRQSIYIASDIDYKFPPQNITEVRPSTVSDRPQTSLVPQLKDKLTCLSSCTLLPMSYTTKLSNQKRSILIQHLQLPPTPHLFVEMNFPTSFIDILKTETPSVTFRQHSATISAKFILPPGVHLDSFAWCILPDTLSSSSHNSSSTTQLIEFVFTAGPSYKDYAFCGRLYGPVDVARSYATASSDSIVFVLSKSSSDIWKNALR